MPDSPTPPGGIKNGDVIAARYEVRGSVGRGGMGRIYRVFDKVLGEEVALKTLLPDHIDDKIILDRFFNEAKIARSLSHPSIVRVHDIGRAGSIVYISMELLKGKSLRQMLDQLQPGQRLPIAGILRMFDALCAALDYAHKFTVHRDIKPENVMILEDGSVKLMDFGISKLMSNPNLTSASLVMGTPHYMAPEQLKNTSTVDARADVYSVGVMLYEVLTGDRPTGLAKPASKIRGEVPAALDPIIEKCCQPDPGKRYQNAEQLRAALRAVRQAVERKTGAGGPTSSEAARAAAPAAHRSTTRTIVGFVLMLAIVVGAFVGLRWAETRRRTLVEAAPAAVQTVAGPASPAVFRELTAAMPEMKARGEKAAADYSEQQRAELIDPVLQRGDALWEAAQANRTVDAERAQALAWDALACYLAPELWPPNMVFVLPTAPDDAVRAPGFFIDTQPMSAAGFAAFRGATNWRSASSFTGTGDEPITGVAFYDALACVANASPVKRLPSAEDLDRAVSTLAAENRVWPSGVDPAIETAEADAAAGAESTDDSVEAEALPARTATPWIFFPADEFAAWGEWTSTSDANVAPADATFGDVFLTWGGAWRNEEFLAEDAVPMNFEDADPAVGFRGALDLPRSLAELNAVK